MSATTKIVGLIAGLSAVAAIGVAVAQGVPPNPYIANPALGAGQPGPPRQNLSSDKTWRWRGG